MRYYNGTVVDPNKEVTDKVTSAKGWKLTNMAPGSSRSFLVTVTPQSGLPVGSSQEVLVRARSDRDGTQRDCLKAITKVK